MIKRWELKFGMMVDDFGYAHIDSDKGEWCKAEDVKALESENAELRERVGELEKKLEEAYGLYDIADHLWRDYVVNCNEPGEYGLTPEGIADRVRGFIHISNAYREKLRILSSPLDVEKGEEGCGR